MAVLKEARGGLGSVALFSFFINLLILTSPIYMLQIYDRVLGSGHIETLVFITLIAGVAVLIMGLLEIIRGRLLGRISRWLDRQLAPELISASMRGTFYGLPASAQALRDLAQIRAFLGGPGVNAILDSPWVPIFIAVIWLMSPALGALAVAAAVILFMLAVLNEYASRRKLKEAGVASIGAMQRADAAIRNADVFHAMGMLPGFLKGWAKSNTAVQDLQLSAGDRNATLTGLSKFFRVFVQILTLGGGAYLVLQQEMTAGGMIAASIIMGRALAPVEQAIAGWKSFVGARDSYDRLQRLMERLPPEPTAMPLPAPTGRLLCEQVVYVPRGRETPVLQGVTFALQPGEALGIVGPSAAGKSTLCRILVGSWQPTRGHCRLDGADVFQWPPEQLGPYIGYLPQDVELFIGTVKENIARLNPDPDPAAVVEAAATAGVHEMILRLPKGYETEIGEGGSFLSGGQRQRIGLARALYGQPKLIVLDEPNASLDSEGEDSLVNALIKAKSWGATVIIVAHQPRILQPVDKVMLLRDGRAELFGPRDEVFAKLRPQRVSAEPRPRIVAPSPSGGA
ncbi:MAG: type I secretion system permease/ATPase [Rhodospirillales bacterium]|jgi:PrtD family type I secretion system ABC transporter|nr:type I secretion system permease/ATPase [Rhodospirillales bacterium]